MLLLLPNILLHRRTLRCAHGESSIAFLPRKKFDPDLVMHPSGGDGFDFPHHIRQAMHRPKADEQMDMIRDTADGFGYAVELFYDAARKRTKAIPPRTGDHADAILSAEDEVLVKREVS